MLHLSLHKRCTRGPRECVIGNTSNPCILLHYQRIDIALSVHHWCLSALQAVWHPIFAVLLTIRVLRAMFGFIVHDWYCPGLQAVLALSPRDSLTPGPIESKPFDSSSPVKEPYMIEGEVRALLLSQQLVVY